MAAAESVRFGAPLEGIRVVEVADHRGAFGGRRLATLAAAGVKVGPPRGSTGRGRGPV